MPIDEDFDSLVASFHGMRTTVVGPELAARMLALNTGNRKVNQRRVDEFALAMASGEFINTGEPIIFSDQGILNDGQNRLHAIVKSGVSIEVDVRFGIPRAAFVRTNTGASRNAADVLSIRGVGSAATIAATVRLLMAYERGLPEHLRDTFDNQAVDSAFSSWPEVPKAMAMVSEAGVRAAFRGTSLYAAVALALRHPKSSGISRWLESVETGYGLEPGDPVYALRERLTKPGKDGAFGRDRQLVRFALMIRSWMLFRDGKRVTTREFKWSRTDKEPFPRMS
jgi:hypothetical protein